jgi:transposase
MDFCSGVDTSSAAIGKTGRKRETDLREILNALRYMARSAGGWRMLPKDFPPWQTVYWWFRRFVRRLMFRTIHDVALMLDRERAGREASPTGGVLDSQSIKARPRPSGASTTRARRWLVASATSPSTPTAGC